MDDNELEKVLDKLRQSQSNPYATAQQAAMEQARREADLQRMINDRARDLAQLQQQQSLQSQYKALAQNVFSTASSRGTSLNEDEFLKQFERENEAELEAKKKAKEAKEKQERKKSAKILEKFLRNGFQTAKK